MRFMARRVVSGDWLTRDLGLTDYELTTSLSSPGGIVGNLPPESNEMLYPDRLRLGEDWATIIYALNDSGDFLTHGIVMPPTQYEAAARITCAGVSAYPQGYIYTDSKLWGPQAKVAAKKNKKGKIIRAAKPEIPRPDPIAIFRDHWQWIQSQPYSDLGVVCTGATNTKDPATGKNRVLIGNYAEPYRLRKWDVPDLGSEMDTLAQITPFEYMERVQWANAAQTNVEHQIEIGYPRIGRRSDLRFAMGENIALMPSVSTIEASANMLIGIGNGEAGPSMVYDEMPWYDGRLRRHRVLTDKTAGKERLKRRLAVFKAVMEQRYDVTSVAVIDHPNAPLSAIGLGDDIRVLAEHPDFGAIDVWVRVLSITRGESDEAAVLTTSNSAFFVYSPTEELS